MAKHFDKLLLGVIPALLGLFVMTGTAQTCAPIVARALEHVSDNCAALNTNEACYGYTRVNATFLQPVAANYFTLPSDRAELPLLESIQTSPFNPVSEEWGIALMKLRANMPNTAPGQSVLFLLLGDVEVRSSVTPENLADPAEAPIRITAEVNANVRSAPTLQAAIVGGLLAGDDLPSDGITADGAWLRVTYNGMLAWISRTVVAEQPEFATLPVVSPNAYTPMQAFYFRTGGIGVPECTEAPSTLVVQGPNDLTVRITANGVNIDISSTIALNTTNDRMEVSVLSGSARVEGVLVPRGFSISAPVDPASGIRSGEWSDVAPIPDTTRSAFTSISQVDESLLHYEISIPDDTQTQESGQSQGTGEDAASPSADGAPRDSADNGSSPGNPGSSGNPGGSGGSDSNNNPGNPGNGGGDGNNDPGNPGNGGGDGNNNPGNPGNPGNGGGDGNNNPGNSGNPGGGDGNNNPGNPGNPGNGGGDGNNNPGNPGNPGNGGGDDNCPGNSCNSNGVPGGNPPGNSGNPGNSGGGGGGGGNNNCPGNSCNSNGVPGGNPPGNSGNPGNSGGGGGGGGNNNNPPGNSGDHDDDDGDGDDDD